VIADWCAEHPRRAPRGLILGVTPELHGLAWPDPDLLLAADRTIELIEHVWPGDRDKVLRSDWREIDLPPGSIDVALCDGGLHLMPWPDGQRALAARLAETLAPGARLAFRLFLPPETPEAPEQVLADLDAGKIRDLNCLKLRLGAAMQGSAREGVCLGDVWLRVRAQAGSGWPALAGRLGWAADHLEVIDAYRGSSERYHFVTLPQVTALFCAEGGAFDVERVSFPTYELGERCPTLVLKRRRLAVRPG
jgi:hypothetical protein